MFELPKPTALQLLVNPTWEQKGIQMYLKREDQIDPNIPGNKWRKLKYNLIYANENGFRNVLTFGGAYSNHIAATAAAAQKYGLKSIGIIRGDELHPASNPTLKKAHQQGMQLIFVSREAYKNRNDKDWIDQLSKIHQAFVIPEGGSNKLAVKGVTEIAQEIDIAFDCICCPIGTGGTLAGLIIGLRDQQQAIGFAALNGKAYLEEEVKNLLGYFPDHWKIEDRFTFGGYGKFDNQLITFMNDFYKRHQVALDPIYTAKMMFGLNEMILNDYFKHGATIVAIHTGGLQGIAGFNEKFGLSLPFGSIK